MITHRYVKMLPSPFEHFSFIDYLGQSARDISPHVHNSFQFLYIMSGEFNITFSDSEIVSLKRGDICVISPEKSHLWSYPGGKLCKTFMFMCSSCSGDTHGEVAELLAPWVKNSHWHISPGPKELFDIIDILEKELKNEEIVNKTTLLAYNLLLLAKTCKIIIGEHQLPDRDTELPIPVIKALYYIEKNYMLPITLEELAEETELATSRFSELFRLHLKKSPIDYLIHFRIKKAESFLHHSNFSVKEIAAHTGFSSIHYFSRTFKRITGKSPGSYKTPKSVPTASKRVKFG